MRKLGTALVGAIAFVMATPDDAAAQCTTCSPLSLPSGSLVGGDLEAARRSSWAVVGQATTGWVGFPRQLADNQTFEARHSARYDLFLTTVQATALHRSGLGVDVALPFGWLDSRVGVERRREFSLGDVEVRPRATTLLGRTVRLSANAGAALPTGGYTVRSGSAALGESSRALTIGRGVTWALGEVEARWEPVRGLGLTTATSGRLPIGEASDGFKWGPEGRVLSEVEVRPIPAIGIAAGGELQSRAAGSVIDPFTQERARSTNVHATTVSVTPAVRATIPNGLFLSLTGRIPVYQDLEGLQFQQGLGVFAGVGYTMPVGGSSAPASPSEPGDQASIARARFVVREYGADWCDTCKRLEPLLEASRRRRSDVHFEKVNVTDWSADELALRVPGASSLPIVEVRRRDGSLVTRLEGKQAFSFSEHIGEDTKDRRQQ